MVVWKLKIWGMVHIRGLFLWGLHPMSLCLSVHRSSKVKFCVCRRGVVAFAVLAHMVYAVFWSMHSSSMVSLRFS
jgi:hypothetical protein